MEQHLTYLSDTYHYHASTSVCGVGTDDRGQWIALEDNLFHPQGGGQPSDCGWVNDKAVSFSRHQDGLVVLHVDTDHVFSVGERVDVSIDAELRKRHAALHTAGHMINWVLGEMGWIAKSGHHFPGESRVEFLAAQGALPVDDELKQKVEQRIQELILSGKDVKTWDEAGVRYCLIEGFDAMQCAGTHIDKTARLVEFQIKSLKLKKGVLRVSYDVNHQ
ncbi:hypothetical protein [Pseudomonas sp. MH9.3]|jgi:Ser-tRNA(Ala) deacylase AlaX|uniref:hypothetical protein n=1 Tax=Pseudomonas sp. MH9.3 TaxID=3048630 RepID=UPI002AC9926F|nr:hypothetical protein [Pseudomonas sp. MH9.3]MEB0108721.1 hypothetical protein [Pseudomonas sp. MH9.3]WPX81843.1 hypothetical protein RHM60_12280 [Pseudomonas sp. MH9.3]WQG56670.1 hypothetical protein RHM66_14365 [Pseudomonas sp. RTB3]